MTIFVFLALVILVFLIYRYASQNSKATYHGDTVEVIKKSKFAHPSNYDKPIDFIRDVAYRAGSLTYNNRYEEALSQLQAIHEAKFDWEDYYNYYAGIQGAIYTLKRKLDLTLEARDILTPTHLTDYASRNISNYESKVCDALDALMARQRTNFTAKDFTKQDGTWWISDWGKFADTNSYDAKLPNYAFDKEKLDNAFGSGWEKRARNIVRKREGLPGVGEGHKNEAKLKRIVANLLKPLGHKVKHHASPSWLGEQHLDVFIPELDLAIEYMGRQHYEPVDYFGGEESYQENKKRDKVKKMKCTKNDVSLIRFKYDEPMEPKHIAGRICNKSGLEIREMDLNIEVPRDKELPTY